MIARTATPRSAFTQRGSIWRGMAWFNRFHDPSILPDGRRQLKLRDAAGYIALPKAEQGAADWQVAMEGLLLVAEREIGSQKWAWASATGAVQVFSSLINVPSLLGMEA